MGMVWSISNVSEWIHTGRHTMFDRFCTDVGLALPSTLEALQS